jgi:hypothetical protein
MKPGFGHFPLGEIYDDHWWNIIPGTGKHKNQYMIKSKNTGEVIFSRTHMDPVVGTIGSNGSYEDNWFEFEAGPANDERANHFRIFCPKSQTVLVSRTHMSPEVTNFYPVDKKYDDQYFGFLLEDMVVDDIKYDIDNSTMAGATPMFMGRQTVTNKSSMVQPPTSVTFTEQEDNEYSFEHTSGFSATIGTEFSVGVPGIADGKVSMSATHTEEFKWGKTTKKGKGTAHTVQVQAEPNSTVVVTATINQTRINVPYTMTLKSRSTGHKITNRGIFHGVCMYNMEVVYT